MLRRLLLCLCAWLLAALASPAAADTRVALVIANSAYLHAPRLPNPPNDAHRIAETLRKVGFATVEKNDLTKRDLEAALKTFAQSARDADVAVIYYAGHGMEQGGLNYLVPVDATLASDQDVDFDTVPLDLLLRSVEGARRLKLVILDACRNNPFLTAMQRSNGSRAIGRGLARVEPEGDVLVAYAAREGSTADDGEGGDSPFTRALTQRMTTPGLEIRLMFGQVRDDVLKATDRRQEPAIYGSLGGDPFYFVAPQAPAAQVASIPAQAGPTARPGGDLLAGAQAARQAGNLDKALAAFDQALQQRPNDVEAHYGRGLVQIERGEWAAAVADFDAILKVHPQNGGAWFNRGRAKERLGDADGALADVTQAIRLIPTNDGPLQARARLYARKGQWALALADANAALALKADADAYIERGAIYEAKGDAGLARADYARALALEPANNRAQVAARRVAEAR